jgi:Raf kinase inhibitor-like YbhB/YbcL family protein
MFCGVALRLLVFAALATGCSSSSPAGGGAPDAGHGAGGSGGSGGSGGAMAADTGAGTGGTGGEVVAGAMDAAPRSPDAPASVDSGADAAVATPDGPAGPFALTSTAFMPGGLIIKKYRCQGENVSPPFSWTPGPAGTRSYAITLRSAGSPHWALWDIPADVTSLPEKIERLPMPPAPAGAKQCKPNVDSSTWYGYSGACPLGGNTARSYFFALFALKVDKLPGVTPDSSIQQVNAAIMANQLGPPAMLTVMAAPNSP